MFHIFNQCYAPGSVQRGDTGDISINQTVQFAGKESHCGHVSALTVPVQRNRSPVLRHYPLTKETRVKSVVLRGHELHGLGGCNVLHDANVGWDSLVCETVHVTLVLPRQKGKNVCTQNIRRNDNYGFSLFSHTDP